MKENSFVYDGTRYRCWVAVSREEYPHYYWCYLDDPDLVKEVGECISYKVEKDGQLQLSEFYPGAYQDLLEAIRVMAVEPLANETTSATSE